MDNARFYDPALGRFTQPDTIVPGAGNPQAFDRYAYVLNNPLRFIDPSGHNYCDSPNAWLEDCDQENEEGWTPPSTSLDYSILSEEDGGRTGISATKLYNYYLELYKQDNEWWWEAFPNFTIWDFISLITYNESGYHPEKGLIFAEAGVRFFIEWAHDNNKTTDVYAVLDWFARFSDSAELMITKQAKPKLQRGQTPADVAAISIVGYSFRHIPASWKDGWAYDRPYNWGNSSVLNPNAATMYWEHPEAMFFTLSGNDPFYIPSGCAWFNWQEEKNQLACPAIVP